jgi:hypothetical protein
MSETRWADRFAVEQKTADWTEVQQACRLDRHSWPTPSQQRMILVERVGNVLTVRQTCTRGCGVARKADMNADGYMMTGWKMDYSDAGAYLMRDENGKSIGRIDVHGRAAIRRAWLTNVRVVDVPLE